MKQLGIKHQLRITTLLPVLLVALLFAIFYNGQFNKDLKQTLSRFGEAYIRQLLPSAQFALMHDDNRILQGLIHASMVNPEVKALTFYNAKGQVLAYRGGKHSIYKPFSPPGFTGDYIESKQIEPSIINFISPITRPKFNAYSKHASLNSSLQADDILGWVSLDIDTQFILIKRYQMYIITIFITLLGLLISLSIHYFLSKRIYLPIARLRRSMKQILRNEFETHISKTSTGELGIIEQGCSHLQQEYLNTLKDLNQHIEVATADLQQSLELLEEKNIELLLEKKKYEEKNRQKSEFIANMSHEIRTPMNGVIGFTNVLLESKLDSLQLDYVKTIKSSAQDLLTIINDILDYSKMDAGKFHLDCIPLDIRACIDEVLSLAAPNAHKKGLDLIPITEVNVPKKVLGDPIRIKQIISNLINNAIKFTDEGHVVIRTSIDQESEKDYIFCLSVTDTGIGISIEDQPKLFNAFNQADTSITRRFGGSGLGLVICKKLVEQMQGRISFTSEIKKGSTFVVKIKLEKLGSYEIEKNCFDNLKVLCFDDNPLYLDSMCNGLSYWGVECVRIASLNKLENALQKNPSDCSLALITINEGCEKQISKLIHQSAIPCIVVSKWIIHNPKALGAKAFLLKPINIQKIHEVIKSVINDPTEPSNTVQELENLHALLTISHPEILIVEDNPVNRMLLTSLLQKSSSIETVENGEEAIKNCLSKCYSAILLDLQMPKLNGIETAKRIRNEALLNKKTPIILISAGDRLSQEGLKNAGIDACLQKPIDEKQLLNCLLKFVKKAKTSAIDWQLCVEKVSGNQTLAEEFLKCFIEELRKEREEFIKLFHEKNIKGIESFAHKLQGACCFCGVPNLQAKVIRLEKQAKIAKEINEIKNSFAQLIQSIDEVIDEFDNLYSISK